MEENENADSINEEDSFSGNDSCPYDVEASSSSIAQFRNL